MLATRRPPLSLGVLAATLAVAFTTALLYPLAEVAPVESLGVLYLLGVLGVSAGWGWPLGTATAVVSAAAFNVFHLPPTGGFELARSDNWVGLAVLLAAALIAGRLADRVQARARDAGDRRREADLSAELARLLLRGDRLADSLPVVSQRLAQGLELPSAVVELLETARPGGEGDPVGGRASGDRAQPADAARRDDVPAPGRHARFVLRDGAADVGALVVGGATEAQLARVQQRVVPALEALLAAALERERLLTDTVETAALRRSDVLKTALLRAVGHDLRTPLTAIVTSAEALRASRLTAAEREELPVAIAAEADRLARLIDDLLDLSRLEADAAEPRPQPCDVEELLRAAADDVGADAARLTWSVDPGLAQLHADAAQLRRAFANLLANALRHGAGHPVSVRARDVGRRILVRVVDRGPGIPSAQLERVFEPFFSGAGQRGSGLGLAIARGFVEVNGGRVWAESLPGQATAFVVELPVPAPPRRVAAPARTAARR